MDQYLQVSECIDWTHPDVLARARALADGAATPEAVARTCFEFVRDSIQHSQDYQLNPVTCSASEVLAAGTGFCYAKSHLLAALLRANGIPAGLCYQRLSLDEQDTAFALHGLNAVHLADHGWYRVDPRGNKAGVDAQFTPPREQLAFAVECDGEADLPEIWPVPLPVVVTALRSWHTYDTLAEHLPDVPLISSP